MPPNQNPEQLARDQIDAQLRAAGWAVQSKDGIDFNEGEGQAIREYQTDTGPADFALFLGPGQPVGIIEAKKETLGHNITTDTIPPLKQVESPRNLPHQRATICD